MSIFIKIDISPLPEIEKEPTEHTKHTENTESVVTLSLLPISDSIFMISGVDLRINQGILTRFFAVPTVFFTVLTRWEDRF